MRKITKTDFTKLIASISAKTYPYGAEFKLEDKGKAIKGCERYYITVQTENGLIVIRTSDGWRWKTGIDKSYDGSINRGYPDDKYLISAIIRNIKKMSEQLYDKKIADQEKEEKKKEALKMLDSRKKSLPWMEHTINYSNNVRSSYKSLVIDMFTQKHIIKISRLTDEQAQKICVLVKHIVDDTEEASE